MGVIGLGFIGSALCDLVRSQPGLGLEIAFVHDTDAERMTRWPPEIAVRSLEGVRSLRPDLVVECAAPEVTRRHGEFLLTIADYLTLSLSALVDDELMTALRAVAARCGTRLLIPHGALPGLDGLSERRDEWHEVTVTFRKPPGYVGEAAVASADAVQEALPHVIYDGPVREAARRFPRNANAMVACALAGIGLDRCRAVFIVDPSLDHFHAEVRAVARDGGTLEIVKHQAAAGVSGTEMPAAVLGSIRTALGTDRALTFV